MMRSVNKREMMVLGLTLLFLMATLGAVAQSGRERARRVVCASQINLQVQALIAYGDSHGGKLPVVNRMAWLQDVPVPAVNEMLAMGLRQEMFYCPANEVQQTYLDKLWMFSSASYDQSWDGHFFQGNIEEAIIVSGYFFLLAGRDSSILRYRTDTEDKNWIWTTSLENPETKELVTDVIIGQEDSDAKWRYNFGEIAGGLSYIGGGDDRSNHLITNEEPAGSNIGYVDGHVAWRQWNPPIFPYVSYSNWVVPRWDKAGPPCWW